jgi:serine/threonine protein kinase
MTSSVHALGPDSLAERLAEDMRRRWDRGERPRAEDYLDSHPELWEHPEAAAELIYEEICLRQDAGEPAATGEVLRRFPQWAAQLRVMLDCHLALTTGRGPSMFPSPGDALGEFLLVAEIGRGSQGRVYLATQPALADRPVVLKLTPLTGAEHLALGRLQHTHIVPLYSLEEFPERRLRGLCLPYFGGTTLAALLAALRELPPARRHGADLQRALDQAQQAVPLAIRPLGGGSSLESDDYVRAVCRLGACLAEALAYAHERGLVHLDVKPSNILLAADGQPMLLDFHLARGPVAAGAPAPAWLGGTPAYLAPEQRAAIEAVRQGRPMPQAVDGRADVYALGLVLYEALAGRLPGPAERKGLRALNPRVSLGLADVIARCLHPRPDARYPEAGALAEDLHRHLADEPLHGVRNRDVAERWRKWRRRRPSALRRLVVALVVAVLAAGTWLYISGQLAKGRKALETGRQALRQGRHLEARGAFERGLAVAEDLPLAGDLAHDLKAGLRQVQRAELAAELHRTAEQLRGLFSADQLPREDARPVERLCRTLWSRRNDLLARLGADLSPEVLGQVRADLLELAVLWSDLRVRLARAPKTTAIRTQVLVVLGDAEESFGPSAVLYRERALHARALGLVEEARAAEEGAKRVPPQTPWEHYVLGCSYLRTGELERAEQELRRAAELEPQGLWVNFVRGRCAYLRGHHAEAAEAFAICVALAPERAVCYYNRGLAYEALGRREQALADYDRAMGLDSDLTPAQQGRERLRRDPSRQG